MVAAAVQFKQGVTTGTAGQAMLGTAGTAVQVQNGVSNAGVVEWTYNVIAVPYNSAVPLGTAQSGATPTWSFTPDVTGCFIVQLITSDASVPANTASDQRAFGVLMSSGNLVPSFTGDQNSLNFGGQSTGWDVYMEKWLALLNSLTTPANVILVSTSGTVTVASGARYYVNLGAAGGNVTFNTTTLLAGQGFYVKLIGSTGGFSATVNPITAGNHIENRASPGSLTTSLVLGLSGSTQMPGDEINLETPDGTNLYY
jgi:hypothetical protein